MKPKLLSVKPFLETPHKGWCGPASLKMVLDYYGVDVSEEELAKICGTTKELGTDEKGLERGAKNFGFKVEIKNFANFEDIQNWLDKGIPVIVDWFTRGKSETDSDVADGHYSVVVGIDEGSIYIQDPEIGKMRKISRNDFMKIWFDFTKATVTSWEDMIIRQIIAIYK